MKDTASKNNSGEWLRKDIDIDLGLPQGHLQMLCDGFTGESWTNVYLPCVDLKSWNNFLNQEILLGLLTGRQVGSY